MRYYLCVLSMKNAHMCFLHTCESGFGGGATQNCAENGREQSHGFPMSADALPADEGKVLHSAGGLHI